MIEINNFRADLSDISAKTATLRAAPTGREVHLMSDTDAISYLNRTTICVINNDS